MAQYRGYFGYARGSKGTYMIMYCIMYQRNMMQSLKWLQKMLNLIYLFPAKNMDFHFSLAMETYNKVTPFTKY